MIVQVEIKNFRNIKEVVYNFDSPAAIIAGKNGLGKSNSLNAIGWLLSDTLLTDHYGKGENDIMSIVPINHQKGQHTEVSIWLETGTKFTKIYKRTYNRAGTKVTGHTSEFAINDVACKNSGEFYKELYTAMKYYPAFNSVKIAEVRLFIDPLFALQKLEAKELRNLLVALGCSVTNEELYESGFEHMRQYEAKYLGKWDVMRKNLKDKKLKLEKQLEEIDAQLKDYANVEEFDEKELEALLAKRDELVYQKKNITSGRYSDQIREISYKIQMVENDLANKITAAKGEIELQIQEAQLQLKIAEDKLQTAKDNAERDLLAQERRLLQEIKSLETSIKYYDDSIKRIDKTLESLKVQARTNQKTKSDYAIRLDIAMKKKYQNDIICPFCGEKFHANPEEYANFENVKNAEIENFKSNIHSLEVANDNLRKEFESEQINRTNAVKELNKVTEEKNILEKELASVRGKLAEVKNIVYDTSEKDQLITKISTLKDRLSKVSDWFVDIKNQVIDLKNKKSQLETGNIESINIQVLHIEENLFPIETEIEKLYVKKSKWSEKLSKQSKYDVALKELNDNDYLLAQVNEFIQTMITKINEKAKKKTGIDFVMLEENLSNENITEVCYATVDGVPFKDLNTSRKVEVGIKFIERCKHIAENDFSSTWNWLPILVDRLEGVDSIEKIKNFTTEQLICTRVSKEEVITIL